MHIWHVGGLVQILYLQALFGFVLEGMVIFFSAKICAQFLVYESRELSEHRADTDLQYHVTGVTQ